MIKKQIVMILLTGVNPNAALCAAYKEAAAVLLQIRCDGLLFTLRVLFCGGGEAHLWNQRLGLPLPSGHCDGTVCPVHILSLTVGTEEKQKIFFYQNTSPFLQMSSQSQKKKITQIQQ